MYERTVSVGIGRFEGLVVVQRHPARDVVQRQLRWSERYIDRLTLDRPIADRFIRSVRHAWDIATGAVDPPHADFIFGEPAFIGRFEFTIETGLFSTVRPFRIESLILRSNEDVATLCATVDEAVRIADEIEHARDFQLNHLPMPSRPSVSSWIIWPDQEAAYASATVPSDLSWGSYRHATATHNRAVYPDPDGCEICSEEAWALIDYYAHLRRLNTMRLDLQAPPAWDRHIDPP